MARVRKPQLTLESVIFATPEQKVLRFLLGEPTTSFSIRVISSKLKGVRGLGGAEGIQRILNELEELGMVDFVDNKKGVRLHDEHSGVKLLKAFAALCDLDVLKELLQPVALRAILFGDQAAGKSASEGEYDLYVVSEIPEEVRKIVSRHPLAKRIVLTVKTDHEHHSIERDDPRLAGQLARGIVIWGSSW